MDEPARARSRVDARELAETMVRFVDTSANGFEVDDLFRFLGDRSVALLAVDAAALVVSDERGWFATAPSSSEAARSVERFGVQVGQGPSWDCCHEGVPVPVPDLRSPEASERWPAFAARARASGFGAVHALPLSLRAHTVGAVTLYTRKPGAIDAEDLRIGQAMADAVTVAALQHRSVRERDRAIRQLQEALSSRVVIEQAKGVLAGRAGIGVDVAFARMRAYARRTNQRLHTVAIAVTEQAVDAAEVLGRSDGHSEADPETR